MGNLIRAPHSEVTATLEVLDRLGVTPGDLKAFRAAAPGVQHSIARVLRGDPDVQMALVLQKLLHSGYGIGTSAHLRILMERQDLLRKLQAELAGPLIDCENEPFVPEGWTFYQHRHGGVLKFDPSVLKPVTKLGDHAYVTGYEFLVELSRDSDDYLNANVLDWLLRPENHDRIQEGWHQTYFFGTIYEDDQRRQMVRGLHKKLNGQWDWVGRGLDEIFGKDRSALIKVRPAS